MARCTPFPAPAHRTVHAVLPHTAHRRRSPSAFGFSRQGLPALGDTTIPYRLIRPNSLGVKLSNAQVPKCRLRRWRLLLNNGIRIPTEFLFFLCRPAAEPHFVESAQPRRN